PGFRDLRSLSLAQYRAGLDEVNLAVKTSAAQQPQRVRRQGSATRPQFGIDRIGWLSGTGPCVGERGADDLAEHLMDFGRGGEVAAAPGRIAGGVIIIVAGLHMGLERHRSRLADPVRKRPAKRRHATLAGPATGSTRSRRFFAVAIR